MFSRHSFYFPSIEVVFPDRVITVSGIPKSNNLDLIRFLLAFSVLLAHSYDLSHNSALFMFGWVSKHEVAVRAFYVISGFLILMSFDNSKSFDRYFSKRLRRILPGYIAVVLITAVFGSLVSNVGFSEYFGADLIKFLLANLSFMNFLHPDLPGVFSENPLSAVNGALRTIKVEVAFYIIVPLIAFALRWKHRAWVLVAIYLVSVGIHEICEFLAVRTGSRYWDILADQLPAQMSLFISGAAIYVYFDRFRRHIVGAFCLGVILSLLGWGLQSELLLPLGLALVVMSLAFGPFMGDFGKHGDFSYGIYVWHFPIIQLLVAVGMFSPNPFLGLGLAIALASMAGIASWFLIEKRFLARAKGGHNTSIAKNHA